jgi:hypothetical protein
MSREVREKEEISLSLFLLTSASYSAKRHWRVTISRIDAGEAGGMILALAKSIFC